MLQVVNGSITVMFSYFRNKMKQTKVLSQIVLILIITYVKIYNAI